MIYVISKPLSKIIFRLLFVSLWVAVGLAPVSGVARAQVPQTSCSEIWDTTITVSNFTGSSRALHIGQGLLATGNLDDCDLPAPPLPPSTAFEAVMTYNSVDYFTDYRPANTAGTITWRVRFQAGTGGDPITFSWSPAALPGAGTWTLRDTITGGIETANMRTQSSYTMIYPGITQMDIVYTTTRCTVTAAASGNWSQASTWNTNCSGIPSTTDDVYIPAGMAVTFNSAAATVESLTIAHSASLSFSSANQLLVSDNAFVRGGRLNLGAVGNLTVSGALTNLGLMQQTKTINVLAGGGPAATVSFLNTGGYGGLTITSNTTNMGSTTVGIIGGQICDTDNTSIWRCFSITPTNSVSNAQIVFYYKANELHASACASMQAWRSTGGSDWVSAGTVGTRACSSEPYSVSYTGASIANTGSYFALRSGGGPTAINLRAFHASSVGGDFSIWLTIGLVGLVFISGIVIWRTSVKQKYPSKAID